MRAMAVVMQRVMGASGAESTSVAASIFMGQTEAPLTIRPFLAGLTQSELFTIMTSGMAHVSGAVMAAYVKIAHVEITHLLTAVIMTAPATIMLAKIMIPETEMPATAGKVKVEVEKPGVNIIDAAARGAGDGLQLALNIGGMLIAFLALIAMVNGMLGWLHGLPGFGWLPGSMQGIFGMVFAPIAWLMGVQWNDCATVGNLLGTRLVLNEFVAFLELGTMQGHAGSSIVRDRHLCAVRIREPQFHRDPDRRHRSAGADAKIGSGAPRHACGCRGIHGEFHVGLHRGNAALACSSKRRSTSQERMPAPPGSAVVLGSGLGGFADELRDCVEVPYSEIPGLAAVYRDRSRGQAGVRRLGRVDLAVLSGRAHLYEGYSPGRVTYAMRIMQLLGVKSVVLTNAAGGINLSLQQGDWC